MYVERERERERDRYRQCVCMYLERDRGGRPGMVRVWPKIRVRP